MKKSLFFIITLLPLFLSGCGDVLYISQLGWYQGYITFYSVPIQAVLEDGQMEGEVKGKIQFIQEVKDYGEKRVGLSKTGGYSSYFENKGPILYVITASEKDRLQLYTWKFPITGKVTYKGFFTQEDALKEKELLEKKDYDTFLQRASAYSTLGWLRDPIFSSMLNWDEASLANMILHEMAHSTVYFKGETDFNEQLATFIGNRGAIDFMIEKYGPDSKEVAHTMGIQDDDVLFSKWVDQAYQELSLYYGQTVSREEKLKGREAVFRSLKEEFRGLSSGFKADDYRQFEQLELNNAVLLAYRRYLHHPERFQIVYESLGRDLGGVVKFFKKIQASGEKPSLFLDQWMKEKGISVLSSQQ